MGSITELEDKIAIQELIARYSFALDFGDIEGWLDCFTEDALYETPIGPFKGRAALRQFITERTEERRERPVRHLMTNIIINVQGERASAKCFLLFLQVVPEGIKLLTTGVYMNEARKTGGTWRFNHWKVEVDSKAWGSQVYPASFLEKNKG